MVKIWLKYVTMVENGGTTELPISDGDAALLIKWTSTCIVLLKQYASESCTYE